MVEKIARLARGVAFALALVAGSALLVNGQTIRLGAGGSEGPVEILVDGKPYLRIDKSGNVTLVNNATLVPFTSTQAQLVPYVGSSGQLSTDSGLFYDATNGKLNLLGGLSANNGPLLVTRKASGGNPVLATAASFYRNSQYNGGTPTANDITNVEFLLQADDNNWYAVGGVGGKITSISAASVGGGSIFYCKPNGAGDTTVPCMYLGQGKKLRVGDATDPTATLEVTDGTYTLSTPTLSQNETFGVKNQVSSFTPGNPTGTTSTTDVMMGVGGTIAFTPKQTGRVSMVCSMIGANNTSGDGVTATMYRGTGTAPSNGAAVTGTQTGGGKTFTAAANNQGGNLVLQAVPSGLTLNTAYWFDVALKAVTGGTASVSSISCVLTEI